MLTGKCSCGAARLTLADLPVYRMFCHCDTCREAYRTPNYSDFVIVKTSDIKVETSEAIRFKAARRRFALQQGHCSACGDLVISHLTHLPGVKVSNVPTKLLEFAEDRIIPLQHIHYHRRIGDVADDLPKVSGGLRSNIACLRPYLRVALGR